MAIDIGDAVLTFLGDTTQLDQAYERVGVEGPAKLQPAAAAVEEVGAEWQLAGQTASTAGAEMLAAGEEGAEGAEVLRASTHEAVGEAALLGEATGVHLPRHVRSFLATLPGVGEALSAAFAATAVLFLIEAVVKGAEKLSEWIADTFIFTEAQKNLNNEIISSNEAIVNYNKQLAELLQKYELIGAKGSQRTAIEFSFTIKDAKQTEEQIRAIRDDIFALNQGWRDASSLIPVVNQMIRQMHADMKEADLKKLLVPEDADREQVVAAFSSIYAELNAKQKVQQQEQANAEKTFDGQRLQEAIALAEKQQRIAEQLYFNIAKARDQAGKLAEKSADDDAKIVEARGAAELKKEQDRVNQEIELQHQKLQAAIAEADGDLQHTQQIADQKALVLKKDYDTRLISGQQYLAEIKKLQDKELQDLIAILNRKEQLVILEAQNEAAKRGQVLTAADAKELKGYIDLENQKQKLADQFTTKFTKDEDLIAKASDKVFKTRANWDQFFKDLATKAMTTGQVFQRLGQEITASIAQSVEAAVSGSDGFGQAMEKILKSALASLSGVAVVQVITELAKAASDLATIGMEWHAGLHFKAAAEWAAVGAIAGVAGAAIPGGSGGGGGGGGASGGGKASITQNASTQTSPNPTASVNVTHLYSGAIVTKPTLAMVGDSEGGGSQVEGVFPLGDMRAHAELAKLFGGSGGGVTTINHYHLPGFTYTTADVTTLSKRLTRAASTGRARLSASNSSKVTRKA